MQWYYSKNGTQLGPVDDATLRAKITSGEIAAVDLVWREGMADWLVPSRVPELQSLVVSPAVPMAGGPPHPQHYARQPMPYQGVPMVPSYLWQSIVVTLLCCLPFGVVAIVYAAKVDSLRAAGDTAGAMAASSSAKTWCIVGASCGLLAIGLWLLMVIGMAASAGVH